MAEVIRKQLWAWESQDSVARALEDGRRRLVAVMVARALWEDGDIPGWSTRGAVHVMLCMCAWFHPQEREF